MTRRVAPDRQGRLRGAANSVQSIAQLPAPFLFTLTFACFIGPVAPLLLPDAPFLRAAALLVVAMAIAMRTTARWA
jgi:DHA1 family tetracycline resistance protein-like MFS transporter